MQDAGFIDDRTPRHGAGDAAAHRPRQRHAGLGLFRRLGDGRIWAMIGDTREPVIVETSFDLETQGWPSAPWRRPGRGRRAYLPARRRWWR